MSIVFHEQTRVFCLETKTASYQCCIDQFNYLLHLYYGKKIFCCDMKHLLYKRDRGFAGVPYESGNDRTFSLDTLPQEYPTAGLADYRTACLSVLNADGSCAADLRYRSHKIYAGRAPLPGLPHVFGTDMDTLEISLYDDATQVEAVLFYHVLEEFDVIVRHAKIINHGPQAITINRALSTCVDFHHNTLDLINFYGKHTMERCLNRQMLTHSNVSFGSTRGASSHQQNPFAIICDRHADEEHGACYGFSFVYSGNFLFETEVDQIGQTRVVMGIHPEDFRYILQNEECFDTPEVVQTFSCNGFSALSQNLHRLVNTHLCRMTAVNRPVVINNWEATYFDFDEEKLLALTKEAAQLGIDMLVIDDGWFGERNDDTSSLGDWFVNRKKIKSGLVSLCKKINSMGVQVGLWFEPEMISENSRLYQAHPDWCLAIPNRKCIRSRHQFVLNFTNPQVVNNIFEQIHAILTQTAIRFIKWDMNRHLSTVYAANLEPARQGEVHHRYILGLYSLLERLHTTFPDLLIEGCSGGGGRFDLGMLYYTPQIWCSDNTDAIDRIKIQYGTSFGYPLSSISAHVSVCPNHQTKRMTPFSTRGAVAMTGAFGYELNLLALSDEEKNLVKEQIQFYKSHQTLFRTGNYFRLTNPFENHDYTAWQYVSEDQRKAAIFFVLLRNECNKPVTLLRLQGLIPEAQYRIGNNIYSGSALMYGGIPIHTLDKDYESAVWDLEIID